MAIQKQSSDVLVLNGQRGGNKLRVDVRYVHGLAAMMERRNRSVALHDEQREELHR